MGLLAACFFWFLVGKIPLGGVGKWLFFKFGHAALRAVLNADVGNYYLAQELKKGENTYIRKWSILMSILVMRTVAEKVKGEKISI